MARITILKKQLSYDEARDRYYVIEYADGVRRTTTFRSRNEAIAALFPGAAALSPALPKGAPPPGGSCTLGPGWTGG